MLRLFFVMAVAALPVSAQECPDQLGSGVVVGYDDLSVAELTATGVPGVLREWVVFSDDGEGYEVLALFGIYTLRTANFDATGELADTIETTFYAQTPTRPEPDQRIEGIMAEVERNGGRFVRYHDLITGGTEPVMISDCLYFGFNAELRIYDPEGAIRVMFSVIPSLDVAILTGSEDALEPQFHVPVSIAALNRQNLPDPQLTLPMALD